MKLLDTTGGNTKLKKSDNSSQEYRLAGLSLMPDDILCPYRNVAGCAKSCLESAGMGVFSNVKAGRQRKSDWWHGDRAGFLDKLRKELTNFEKLCKRQGVKAAVRLNVLSDIPWEKHGIPQEFPDIFFYDYTKNASRLGKTPSNYELMFSYSNEPAYQKVVVKALKSDVPMSVVFRNGMPKYYKGRRVIDGDASDLVNVKAGKVIVGLVAKGKAKKDEGNFVVDNLIAVG
tara:strand:- start:30 stop:719 length:690 start_codon:yes stop_codon:yes gene_type:complete